MSTTREALERAAADRGFEVEAPPVELAPVAEIRERRRDQFARKKAAYDAAQLITVRVRMDGPVGILHMGDPHIDDDGCDIATLEKHVEIINKTKGLFGANVGDLRNNWIGRLAHLYGQQSTSAREALALTEWLVGAVPWIYLVGGNHDAWAGENDPIEWIMRTQPGVFQAWGARLRLVFPNGKEVRINARHDFRGHSMWNPAHGVSKAAQMGWRDHVLTCGHLHISGYAPLKCPASGLISHALRIAGYKLIDRYATQLGLPNQNISPAVVTVIDPTKPDDSPGLVTVFWDVEEAAAFLRWKRGRK
jgi:hypothetical protein